MVFSKTLTDLPNPLLLDDIPIMEVNSTEFLGVSLDNKLSWNVHIDTICKGISCNIGIIAKLKCVL